MKGILILLAFLFAYSAWSDVNYPVKNYRYITDWDYRTEVEESDKYVVMVFSSKSCLERSIIDRSCFLFEKKLDYFIPRFSPLTKVVGLNTYFENYQTVNQFQIHQSPTVIILKNNFIIQRFEATFQGPDVMNGRLDWQDELLKQVLETVMQIR